MNSTYTDLPIWSEYISKTELPKFSKPTITNQEIIFEYSIIDENSNYN